VGGGGMGLQTGYSPSLFVVFLNIFEEFVDILRVLPARNEDVPTPQ
jgi:hypothetical protein